VSDDDVESHQLPYHQLDLPFVLVQDSIVGFESEALELIAQSVFWTSSTFLSQSVLCRTLLQVFLRRGRQHVRVGTLEAGSTRERQQVLVRGSRYSWEATGTRGRQQVLVGGSRYS
jgi:hypothetical protein